MQFSAAIRMHDPDSLPGKAKRIVYLPDVAIGLRLKATKE